MLGDFSKEAYEAMKSGYASRTESVQENEIFDSTLVGEIHTETSGLRAKYLDVLESELSSNNPNLKEII